MTIRVILSLITGQIRKPYSMKGAHQMNRQIMMNMGMMGMCMCRAES